MITKQVKFKDVCNDSIHGGILVINGNDKYIICGCCGGVIEVDEDVEIIEEYNNWVDISDSIIGE